MSMVEVKSTDPTGKVVTLGVISKFLYEMILAKLDELNFCKILSKKSSIGNETCRRLSIHKNHNSNAPEFLDYVTENRSSIRSVFVEDVTLTIMAKVFNTKFIKSISLLKVLDLFNANIDFIPNEVGRLLNLQYLSLRGTRVSTLPKTISKLENLQTMDLKQTSICELPKEFINLVKLRHFLGDRYDTSFDAHCMSIKVVKIPEGLLAKTSELQKLAFFDVNVRPRTWVKELRSLTQLRKLGIIGLRAKDGDALCYVIDGMKCLLAINIFTVSKSESINLTNVKFPPMMLQRLYLSGPLLPFPTSIKELDGLVKIRLRWSRLHDDPLQTLQLLSKLVELQLLEAFVGEQLTITSGGFQKLKVLHLLDLHPLKSLFITKGALPHLDEMSVGESKYLQVPSGIKYLSTLTKLHFYNMPSYFTDCIREGKPPTVEHVKSVLFYNKNSNGGWQIYSTLR